jgi:hypothetical protein
LSISLVIFSYSDSLLPSEDTSMILIDIRSSCSDDTHAGQSTAAQGAFSHHIAVCAWDFL